MPPQVSRSAAGNNQTVIVGATGITAGLNLSNGTSSQSGLASLDVNSLGTGVAGSTGNKLVASGSSQSYTATLSTSTLGTQVETFSLNVGDDHTLPGASSRNESFDQCNADGSRPRRPKPDVDSGNNQTVIVGATGISAGLNLSNGTLNQTGLASLDVNSLGTGVVGSTGGSLVASGSSQPYTATLKHRHAGHADRRRSRSMSVTTIRCRERRSNEHFDQCNPDRPGPCRPKPEHCQRQQPDGHRRGAPASVPA